MQITFGLFLDGPAEPDGLGGRRAAAGEVAVGPMGLLSLLEARLGLSGAFATAPVRAAQFAACLREAGRTPRFYSRSLECDPIGTARVLLAWRDGLIAGGWNGAELPAGSPRLRDLAAVEAVARSLPLAPGTPDRIRLAIAALPSAGALPERLSLLEPEDLLGPDIRDLVLALSGAKVRVEAVAPAYGESRSESDLARLQNALDGGGAATAVGDGSLVRLVAESDNEAADAVACWLEDGQDGCCVVLPPGDDALDRAMTRRGMPVTGTAPLSRWRPALQVLPLAVASRWRPLEPQRLFELLLLPGGPIPIRVAARMARALADAPGIGGPAWERAISELGDPGDAGASRGAVRALEQLERWLPGEGFAPDPGPSRDELAALTARVASWAAGRSLAEHGDAAALAALGLAREVTDVLRHLEAGPVGRLLWEALHEASVGSGVPLPGPSAERGHVPFVRHPGAIVGPVARLLWWDFTADSLAAPRPAPWTAAERAALRIAGIRIEPAERHAARETFACRRAVGMTHEQLVLVTPRLRQGRASTPHPEQASFSTVLGGHDAIPSRSASEWLLEQDLAAPLAVRPLHTARRWWRLPPSCRLPARAVESYSSLEKLIDRPHAWVLGYPARLVPGVLRALPSIPNLLGTLGHRLVQGALLELEAPAEAARPGRIEAWVDRTLPGLLAREGASLLAPGLAAELESLRSASKRAARALAERMAAGGWTLAGVEEKLRAPFFAGALEGSLDLLLRGSGGRWAVLDLKWGGQAWREREVRESIPLQLLLYGRLIREREGAWPRLGYFILQKADLLPRDVLEPDGTGLTGPGGAFDPDEEWERLGALWRWRREQLDRGIVEVVAEGTEADDGSNPPDVEWQPAEPESDEFQPIVGWTGAFS